MKKNLLWLLSLLVAGSLHAQTQKEVITGENYSSEVYYQLGGGTQGNSLRSAWDMAFTSKVMSISVLANTGAGVELYTYPGGSGADWENVDTTGITWTPMYNSIESWDEGAFTRNTIPGDQMDYGWGRYDMSTHNINGDSLFILKTIEGDFKKLHIVQKQAMANIWIFKYANLDGTGEVQDTIDAGEYDGDHFIYYSVDKEQVAFSGPEAASVDLVFTRYFDYNIPYFVSGVLSNDAHIVVQEISGAGIDQAGTTAYDEAAFEPAISTIGSDWKSFNMGTFTYDVADTVVYFLKRYEDSDSSYFKLYFTDFSGSSEGKYTFMEEELSFVSSGDPFAPAMLDLYPNPASAELYLVYDFSGTMQIDVLDLNGRLIQSSSSQASGFGQYRMDVSSLEPGLYLVRVSAGGQTDLRRFVVN